MEAPLPQGSKHQYVPPSIAEAVLKRSGEKECSICKQEFLPDGRCDGSIKISTVLCCSKHFHTQCLQSARRNNKLTCPLCRADLPSGGLFGTPAAPPSIEALRP